MTAASPAGPHGAGSPLDAAALPGNRPGALSNASGRQEIRRARQLDFTKPHSVYNDGDEPRIHLILELRVNEFLRRVFPKPELGERLERLLLRFTMPAIWRFMRARFTIHQMLARLPK